MSKLEEVLARFNQVRPRLNDPSDVTKYITQCEEDVGLVIAALEEAKERIAELEDVKNSVAVAKLVDATHAYSQCIRSSEHAANSKEKFAAFMAAIEEVGKLGDE